MRSSHEARARTDPAGRPDHAGAHHVCAPKSPKILTAYFRSVCSTPPSLLPELPSVRRPTRPGGEPGVSPLSAAGMTPANISILVAPPSAPPPAAPLSAFPPTIPPPAAPPPFCVDAEYTGFVDAVTTMPLTCDDLREFNGCDPEEDYSEQIREKCPIACGLCTPPPAPPNTPCPAAASSTTRPVTVRDLRSAPFA